MEKFIVYVDKESWRTIGNSKKSSRNCLERLGTLVIDCTLGPLHNSFLLSASQHENGIMGLQVIYMNYYL
jgi:hypothetical protein